jgi:site-specific DNA-methyltransferase (adenine-specific)
MPEIFHAGPNLGRLSDVTIIHGDCIEAMRELADESIDAIVCDPPYGLGFMGKEWDSLPPGLPWAQECLRVLKPGGHLLAFGGTRTWHRLAVAVEDAGFEIRDSIAWLYSQGFPKSLDVSKAIDKAAGAKREVVGVRADFAAKHAAEASRGVSNARGYNESHDPGRGGYVNPQTVGQITAPATPEAEQWQGFGTALKPSHEPIVVARKPFRGTVAQNVLAHGTGAFNIDGCRIGTEEITSSGWTGMDARRHAHGTRPADYGGGTREPSTHAGRWPANVVLDSSQAAALDEQSGNRRGFSTQRDLAVGPDDGVIYGKGIGVTAPGVREGYNDSGGASRFFKVAEEDTEQQHSTSRAGSASHPRSAA